MKVKKTAAVLMILGAFLLVASLALALYNFVSEKKAADFSEYAVASLSDKIKNNAKGGADGEDEPASDISDIFELTEPDIEMPKTEIDGVFYIGILEIPSLSLTLPVIDSVNNEGLKKAPCRYSGSLYKGNLVIAAHNFKCHFAGLSELTGGEDVFFTDVLGNRFAYKADKSETVGAYDVQGMTESGYELTLFTCNYNGRARNALRCKLQNNIED